MPTPSCHMRARNARACGRRYIDKHHSRIATLRTHGARPRAPFNSVKPNIYEYKRTKCDRIGLVRAHIFRYCTHIQHTRANKYLYPLAVVPPSSAAALLSPARRGSQLLAHTPAARIPTCPGWLLVRIDALVPPAHSQRACLRAARYRQTSLTDRHISGTRRHGGARPRALLLAFSPIFMNVIESNAAT